MPFILLALLHPINDVTTDFKNPPQFIATENLEIHKGHDLSYPTKFIERQKRLHPDVKALHTLLVRQQAYQFAYDKVEALPHWSLTHADPSSYRIEAVAETPLMKFKDDVVIEIRESPVGGSDVHMRSRSRIGKGDFGANAKRILSFFKDWPNAS